MATFFAFLFLLACTLFLESIVIAILKKIGKVPNNPNRVRAVFSIVALLVCATAIVVGNSGDKFYRNEEYNENAVSDYENENENVDDVTGQEEEYAHLDSSEYDAIDKIDKDLTEELVSNWISMWDEKISQDEITESDYTYLDNLYFSIVSEDSSYRPKLDSDLAERGIEIDAMGYDYDNLPQTEHDFDAYQAGQKIGNKINNGFYFLEKFADEMEKADKENKN